MKAIYLSETEKNIRDVYATDERVFCKQAILCEPDGFKDVEYIFSTWGMPEFTEDEIKTYLPSLKAVFYGAGTVKYFAKPFLECGVKVFSAWAANAVPVAEYTVAQIILANKGFYMGANIAKSGAYEKALDYCRAHKGNYGVKVGIIGAGMIGKLVIEMLKSYKLDVLVFDPFLPDSKALELGAEKCSLERLFEECTVVSNHLADNDKTKGILNKALFEKLPPYATFINTGRGAQVVESDLISVLSARPDITALLDVTYPEPPEKDSALYTLENCILTPHIAGSLANETRRMGEYIKEEYERFIKNEPCKYEVTLEMLQTMA